MKRNTLDLHMAQLLEDKRKIDQEIAAQTGIVNNGNTLGFEFLERGELKFVKWRSPDKRFWIDPPGQKLQLWNLDCLRDHTADMVIITEGELDAASWMTVGAPYVVSVPNGAPSKPSDPDLLVADDTAFSYLWNGEELIPELRGVKKVILSTDADHPGVVLRYELAKRIGSERCWYLTYPEGCKDANDVLVKLGRDALMDLLDTAKPFVPNELVPLMELPVNPLSISHSTGWRDVDRYLQIVPPELMVISGQPNSGKSEWAWALGAQLARVHNWRGAIIQFEDGASRVQTSFINYAQTWSRRPGNGVGNPAAWVNGMILSTMPEDDDDLDASDRTMKWVLKRIKEAGQRHGCRWVIIDPWNEIEHDWQKQYTETQYISRMLKLLKQAARKYSLAIILIAHPKVSAGEKTPADMDLNDISGGLAWKAKADHGIMLARLKDEDNRIIVKVCKVRDQRIMGEPGMFVMEFKRSQGEYEFIRHGD